MRKPRFLPFSLAASLRIAALSAVCALLGACAGTHKVGSPEAAEKLAVSLANDKCQHDFGRRPFKTGPFPATRSDDRWLWGWLDVKESQGYTAQVAFHADQSEPEVVVNFTSDSQVDMQEPDAPSLNAGPDSGMVSQPEPQEGE